MNEKPAIRSQRAGSVARVRAIGIAVGSLVVIGLTLGVIGGLAWWKKGQIEAAMSMPPPPEMATIVGIREVTDISWRKSTTSIGTILAPRSITVNNEYPGTVTEVLFEPGSTIEAGTTLIRLDTSIEQSQLEAARARAAFTLSTLERNRQMADTDAITINELEEIQSQWIEAKSRVEELQAIIARKTIIAPFRSRVGLSDVHEGQYLAGGSMITTLQSIEDHLLVEFTLAQEVINQLPDDAPVEIEFSGQNFPAVISAVDAQADRQTRNVRVRARIDNPPGRIGPGDSVPVRVAYGDSSRLPSVPAEAIRRSPQGDFVFVAEKSADGRLVAHARPVVVAATVDSQVAIASGLVVGEEVVVEGAFKLTDGALLAEAGADTPKSGGEGQPE